MDPRMKMSPEAIHHRMQDLAQLWRLARSLKTARRVTKGESHEPGESPKQSLEEGVPINAGRSDGRRISLRKIRLGMGRIEVLQALGEPDGQLRFPGKEHAPCIVQYGQTHLVFGPGETARLCMVYFLDENGKRLVIL